MKDTSVPHCSQTDSIMPHSPSRPSFHSVTLPSAADTANTLPATEKLTRHTTASKGGSLFTVHPVLPAAWLQICTTLSSAHEAIVCVGSPIEGAQATSLTHPECGDERYVASNSASSSKSPLSSNFHTLTAPSLPPVTSLACTGGAASACDVAAAGAAAGAQHTALHPIWCALGTVRSSQSMSPPPLHVRIEMQQSLDTHANFNPSSCGANEMALTEDWCPMYSYILLHCPLGAETSFHTHTLRSYEHEARIAPNLGCAHAICHIGPSCPTMLALSVWLPFSGPTSNTLIVASLEHVASLLP
mmetsp:Transcript_32996/g.77130  ORF Transcript_32996/g.77130 Transcript_32996/m.77130 type:complete len:302 (+) Transcript_32996:899-1804(+)